jgi:hypothetical protein
MEVFGFLKHPEVAHEQLCQVWQMSRKVIDLMVKTRVLAPAEHHEDFIPEGRVVPSIFLPHRLAGGPIPSRLSCLFQKGRSLCEEIMVVAR